MSKLTALAKLTTQTGELVPSVTNSIHLLAGAVGGYRNAVGASRSASQNWRELSPQARDRYKKAYGKNAQKYFQRKQVIRGAVTGAMRWHGYASLGTGMVINPAISSLKSNAQRIRQNMNDPLWQQRSARMGNVGRVRKAWEFHKFNRRRNTRQNLKDYLNNPPPQTESAPFSWREARANSWKYIKKNAPGFIKSQAKSMAIDAAWEYGPANIYGEVARYANQRGNQRGGKRNSESEKRRKGKKQKTGVSGWKAFIRRG